MNATQAPYSNGDNTKSAIIIICWVGTEPIKLNNIWSQYSILERRSDSFLSKT